MRDKAAAAAPAPAIQDPDDNAWAASVNASAPLLNPLHTLTKRNAALGEGVYGLTSFPTASRVHVDYNGRIASQSRNKRIGQLASTFTHELAAHGKYHPLDHPNRDEDSDQEHDEMHAPETRNIYLQATHRTLGALENEHQKRAFVKSWHADMMSQIGDSELGKGEKRGRRDWTNRQRDKMKRM